MFILLCSFLQNIQTKCLIIIKVDKNKNDINNICFIYQSLITLTFRPPQSQTSIVNSSQSSLIFKSRESLSTLSTKIQTYLIKLEIMQHSLHRKTSVELILH